MTSTPNKQGNISLDNQISFAKSLGIKEGANNFPFDNKSEGLPTPDGKGRSYFKVNSLTKENLQKGVLKINVDYALKKKQFN